MLIDWTIYGLLTWALAAMLNATAFKVQPASRTTAWVATVAVFLFNLVAMTALQYIRYQAISDSLGVKVMPRSPLDAVGAFTFAWIFFALIRKRPKVGKATGDVLADAAPSSSSPLNQTSAEPKPLPLTETTEKARLAPTNFDEALWAQALTEFEGSNRRAGLWARSFSQAGGNEATAKAAYLGSRVLELERERKAEVAEQEQLKCQREERERLAKLAEAESAYALLPKGKCPNCAAVQALTANECTKCRAVFGSNAAWKLVPLNET